ncbi:MAG: hypothetical protein GF329_15445 [Candidatus Lokiarchaeota archaeon]|nr:hypothetical protein [Candidatus Lokiarchaeota archaeon]
MNISENNTKDYEKILSIKKSVDPKEFLDWKINVLLVGMVYTSLFSRFIKKYGNEKAKILLHNIGARTAQLVKDKYTYKGKKFNRIIKYCLGKFWGSKSELRRLKGDSEYLISIKDCIFCSSLGSKIEDLREVHYCEPTSGFIEEIYNQIASEYKLKIRKIEVKTIASKVMGSKKCQYKIKIID